jgi:hypothetical protein
MSVLAKSLQIRRKSGYFSLAANRMWRLRKRDDYRVARYALDRDLILVTNDRYDFERSPFGEHRLVAEAVIPESAGCFLTGWGMRGCVHDGEDGHKWREAASEEVA